MARLINDNFQDALKDEALRNIENNPVVTFNYPKPQIN